MCQKWSHNHQMAGRLRWFLIDPVDMLLGGGDIFREIPVYMCDVRQYNARGCITLPTH